MAAQGATRSIIQAFGAKIHEKGISTAMYPLNAWSVFPISPPRAVARIAPINFVSWDSAENNDKNVVYLLLDGVRYPKFGSHPQNSCRSGCWRHNFTSDRFYCQFRYGQDLCRRYLFGAFGPVNHLKDALFLFQANEIKTVCRK